MADAAPATAPTSAIGYTQAPLAQWWMYENEQTPELQWPNSVFVYDQMRRTDSQCKAVLKAVMLPVLRTPWRIDPAGARPEVVQLISDDLGLPIVGQPELVPARQKGRFSWTEHLRHALLSLVFGHSFFEVVYRVDDDGSLAHLAKLEYRPPTTIERIDVAKDGGLVAIKQYWTEVDRVPQPIPVSRLVAYVNEREGGNWLGTSLLRSAYKNWLLKDRLLRVQAQTIERNGMGIPKYKAQENATEADITKGAQMAQALRAGEAAGLAVPNGADIELMGVSGTLPDAKPVIDYHDDAIARAVLAHFLNLGSQTGSWALGATLGDFFTLSLQTVAQFVADTATRHIIEDLVDVNFGPDEPAPRLCFDEIGTRQQPTAESLAALVSAGILHPDSTLEGATRQFYGLPPAAPDGETPAPEDTGTPDVAVPDAPTQTGDYSVAASAGVDLEDEASWIAAAAGVDTHPGGERLKRMWVYGQLASKWVTWTDLYDHLKKYIKDKILLRKTVSAWYRLRYGHNPPRHHVTASALTGSPEALAAYAEEFGGTDGVDDEAEDWDLAIDALSAALDELSGAVSASFNPRQARNPKGSPGGGRFRSMVETLKDAIEHHRTTGAAGHPFASFDREQLRRVARKRGINLERGESKDSIAAKLLADLRGGPANSRAEKLAERQSTAGQKAAGVGVRKPSKAREERLRRLEEQTNAALDELDRKGPPVTGTAALTAPPLKLSQMTASGDPRAAALWFRTGDNSLDTRSGMPGFVELNRHMRGQVLGGPEMDARVADIESAMADSKLTRPIVVYRGMDTYELGSIGELEGVEFSDRAFASATTDEAHAKNFGTVLRITVPSGVGAIRMADRDPDRFTESEILLDRDLKYRVVGERIERNERGRISKHELDVEVIP